MSVLDDILVGVREDLAVRQAETSIDEVKDLAAARPPALDGAAALLRPGVAVIAEVKRSSPSKGALAAIADPAALAEDYEAGGASVISVLTERRRFGGSLADLRAVRARVSVPLLRKDFVVSSYQLWEGRAHGADLSLLIVAALEQEALVSLVERSHSLGMTALVEVHDESELERAVAAGARIIGVNARDLDTLQMDAARAAVVLEAIPKTCVPLYLSGLKTPEDVRRIASTRAHAALIGETLMRENDPRERLQALVAAAQT